MPIAALSKPKKLAPEEKANEPKALTALVQSFLDSLPRKTELPISDSPTLRVSSVISGVAVLYERLRYSLDYREEHLLRRHAIERVCRRRQAEGNHFNNFAKPLLIELVQAQYLKNDTVPESAVVRVQEILDRYSALLSLAEQDHSKDRSAIRNWLFGLLSAELDEELAPAPEDKSLVNLMVGYVIKDNSFDDWPISLAERERQVFISCYRALFAFDPQTLHFFLLLKQIPNWRSISPAEAVALWPDLCQQRLIVEQSMRQPVGSKLYRSLKSRAIVFHALKDIVMKYPNNTRELLLNESRISAELEQICGQYYRGARRRLYRSAVRSTVYIFLTKIVLALLAEAPAEQYLYGVVASGPLLVNIIFPPTLMFFLTATTRFPGLVNTKHVWRVLAVILYGSERRVFSSVKFPTKFSAFSVGIFSLFYMLTFTATFGAIIYVLINLQFTYISISFFLFFLTIVSFFAIRIRQPVRDLFVSSQRENILAVLINFFSLPILRVGQWISLTSARVNIFLYLFDYLLEAPFKSFLAVFEEVLGFFREQREDIV